MEQETNKSQCKPYSKNKLLWKGIVEVNGGSKAGHSNSYDAPCVFFWRTTKAYMTGKTDAEIMAESETIKRLHSEKGYEFCLVRDYLRPRTETCWGKKFIYDIDGKHYHHKLVIKKGEKTIFECFERWELVNFCEGIVKKEKEPETPSEIFRYFTPVKFFIKAFDSNESKELSDKLYGNTHNSPYNIQKELSSRYSDTKKLWVVYIIGMAGRCKYDDYSTTWFIMSSKNKPRTDEAIHYLMDKLDMYYHNNHEGNGDLLELLLKFKEFEMDLNKIDLNIENRLLDLWTRKFVPRFEDIMGERYRKICEFWNKTLVYS